MKRPRLMLFRFCLYGFLKGQLYYEAFLLLVMRQMGLSWGDFGVLIGFRALCVSLMEIPCGAVADVLGRRRSMIASALAYIGFFLIFGLCSQLWTYFVGMFLFAVGESFRTGTHKAMIFDWLDALERGDERTAIYGRTRSWSQLGSAVAVVIGAVLFFHSGSVPTSAYQWIFLACIIPYILNIINFATYPSYLDGPRHRQEHSDGILRTLSRALSQTFRVRALRRLLVESMSYEGLYQSSKHYVQPMIKTACLGLPIMLAFNSQQRAAVAIGLIYFGLYVLSSFASRGAGRFADIFVGQRLDCRILWILNLMVFGLIGVGIFWQQYWIAIAAFVALAIFQNFWRPILVGHFAAEADASQAATVLSIESQAKSLSVAIIAPILGGAVQAIERLDSIDSDLRFLPISFFGVAVSAIMLFTSPRPSAKVAEVKPSERARLREELVAAESEDF